MKLLQERTASTEIAFKRVYGSSVEFSDLAILGALEFFFLNNWQKRRDDSKRLGSLTYNPRAVADVGAAERNKGRCEFRTVTGERSRVWDAVERIQEYEETLSLASRTNRPLSWSKSYVSQGHVQAWLQSAEAADFYTSYYGPKWSERLSRLRQKPKEVELSSPGFDLDIILSLHAVAMDGTMQRSGNSCGRIAELRHCDAFGYSPFFAPTQRLPDSCWYAKSKRSNRDLERFFFSDFGRELSADGFHLIPLSTQSQCRTKRGTYFEPTRINADWPTYKQQFLPVVSREFLLAGVEGLRKNPDVKIGTVYINGSVEQAYRRIAGLGYVSDAFVQKARCKACLLNSERTKLEAWSLESVLKSTDSSETLYCPRSCLKGFEEMTLFKDKNGKVRDRRLRYDALPEEYSVRKYFTDLGRGAAKNTLTSRLNTFFSELRSEKGLSEDPIVTATALQSLLNRMHPFSDGNGRTSKSLMDIVLRSLELPIPAFDRFDYDAALPVVEYAQETKKALARSLSIIDSCTEYTRCSLKRSPGILPESREFCAVGNHNPECLESLPSYSLRYGKTFKLTPCDCATVWKKETELPVHCRGEGQ